MCCAATAASYSHSLKLRTVEITCNFQTTELTDLCRHHQEDFDAWNACCGSAPRETLVCHEAVTELRALSERQYAKRALTEMGGHSASLWPCCSTSPMMPGGRTGCTDTSTREMWNTACGASCPDPRKEFEIFYELQIWQDWNTFRWSRMTLLSYPAAKLIDESSRVLRFHIVCWSLKSRSIQRCLERTWI